MKKLLKIFAFVISIILTFTLLAGCSAKEEGKTEKTTPLVEKLNEADYKSAYELAETDGEKNLVRSENTVAYMCSYLKAAFEHSDLGKTDIKVLNAWANGHQPDGDNEAKYVAKLKITIEDESQDFYCYYKFNVDDKKCTQDTLIEAETAEAFNDMSTEEQMTLTLDENNACYNINLMIDNELGYEMPDGSIKRLNKVIDDGKTDDITLSADFVEALCEELPLNTEFK